MHVVGRLGFGGAEKLVFDLARKQSASGHRVSVAVVSRPRGPDSEMAIWSARISALEEEGIDVYSLADSTRDLAGAILALRRLPIRQSVDLVHAHLLVGAIASRFGLGTATPMVWTLHATEMGFPNRVIRLTDGWVSIYVGCAPAVTDAFQPFTRRPVVTVNNGVDLSGFTPKQRPNAGSQGHQRLLSVGSLRASKNYPRLVEAVTLARGLSSLHSVTMELSIVGEGPERPNIENTIRANGAESFVRLLGARDDVSHLYQDADIFVLASDLEGLPLSLIEALASGLPCVLTPFTAAREMLAPGVEALIASSFAAEEVASLITRLAEDSALQRCLSSASLAAAHRFSIDSCVHAYEEVYADALADAKPT